MKRIRTKAFIAVTCALFAMTAVCQANSPVKKWTVAVYCAADNDLAPFGLIDINEMETVGSTDAVDIVVQFDGSEKHSPQASKSVRYFIQKDNDFKKVTSPVEVELGEVDMGSRNTFEDFVEWAVTSHPAEKYFIVLWNHGSGWYQTLDASTIDYTSPKDVQDLISAIEEIQGGSVRELGKYLASRRGRHDIFDRHVSLRPFSSSRRDLLGDVVSRVIAVDEGGDKTTALSTTDVRQALEAVQKRHTGQGKFEVIGFDACLMGMVEVMYELRQVGVYAVGSEKTEPGDGWPYDRFLSALVENPAMNGAEIGTVLVGAYTDHYNAYNESATNPFHRTNGTLACIDLGKIADLADALDNLGAAVQAEPELRLAAWKAVVNTQHCGEIARTDPTVLFQLTAHRDVVDLAAKLKTALSGAADSDVSKQLISGLADDVISKARKAIVHFERIEGTPLLDVSNTNGLSVYIPFLKVDEKYSELQMGKKPWASFLDFFKATPEEAKVLVQQMLGQSGEKKRQEKREGRFNSLYRD